LGDNFPKIFGPGLPDGLFSNKKSKFGSILEGIAMQNLGIHIL
jgi:hypothetical protein